MELDKPKYRFTTKDLLANLMILALYVVLTMITYPMSFFNSIRANQNLEFKW
jgi:uncharacterized membrane protein